MLSFLNSPTILRLTETRALFIIISFVLHCAKEKLFCRFSTPLYYTKDNGKPHLVYPNFLGSVSRKGKTVLPLLAPHHIQRTTEKRTLS